MENWLKYMFLSALVFLGDLAGVLETLFYLMMIDTVLGVLKALKLNMKFSFKVLVWGLVSKITLLSIPFVVSMMAEHSGYDIDNFVHVVMSLLVMSEGVSCLINIISIKTGKKIEKSDFMTTGILKIKAGFEYYAKTTLKGFINEHKKKR